MQRFGYQPDGDYPDNGVNYETFSNEDMLEMEPIGPLVTLAPGAHAQLSMSWELFGGVSPVTSEEEADRVIGPLVGG